MNLLKLVKQSSSTDANSGLVPEDLLKYVKATECKRVINLVKDLQGQKGFRTLSVISSSYNEGKTLTSNILALGYATQLKKKVLLISAKYQTEQATIFIERAIGNRESTTNDPVLDIVCTASDTEDKLKLESSDFVLGRYIKDVKQAYDLVIVDTHPLTHVGPQNLDPVVLSSHCDAILLVCSRESFNKENLVTIKETLHSNNLHAKLIGMLQNLGAN